MIIAVVYLLGAIHGFILAAVLAQKEVNKLPNRILAMMMLVFTVDLGMAAFLSFGLYEQYPFFIGLDYPMTLLYGPLLYLYVKALRDGSTKIKGTDCLHFIPFMILLVYMIPFYLGPVSDKIALINPAANLQQTYAFGMINHIKVLHALTYVGGVIYILVSYRKKLKNSFSSIEKINLNWLQNFIAGIVLLAGISAIVHFFGPLEKVLLMSLNEGIYDDITLLSTTIFVYGVGYMGLHQPEVFSNPVKDSAREIIHNETENDGFKESSKNPYQKSGLGRDEAEWYTEQLRLVMEEKKIYRNSDLKLADLAEELDIPAHNLTEIINRYIGQNFYDFVNSYRLDEVKKRLQNSESNSTTLLAIGMDAGFNSKSTFNAVFKKTDGNDSIAISQEIRIKVSAKKIAVRELYSRAGKM